MAKRKKRIDKQTIRDIFKGLSRKEVEEIDKAKSMYRRKWRSGLNAMRREKYRERNRSMTVLENFKGEKNELIRTSILAMGSIQERFNTCGKKDCPCLMEGKRHGPYYYLSLPLPKEMVRSGHPRVKHFYITKDEAWMLEERIKNFKRLQNEAWDELWNEFTKGPREKV